MPIKLNIIGSFFNFKILTMLLSLIVSVFKSSELLVKPLFLPIFKNLFFLSFIISSADKSLKYSKFLNIEFLDNSLKDYLFFLLALIIGFLLLFQQNHLL